MSAVWTVIVLVSVGCTIVTGRASDVAGGVLRSGEDAVKLMLTVMGTMTLWSGLLAIVEESGDVQRIGRGFRRIARPLFPGVTDESAWASMSVNFAANLLGLGNAATPAGIDAARRLATQGETGLRALAMLLALNSSSLQLLPTTVMTMRQAAGSADPAGIWGPTLLVSAVTTGCAALGMRLLQGGKCDGRIRRNGSCRCDRVDRPQGSVGAL